jgi:signal transduction histidine kinase
MSGGVAGALRAILSPVARDVADLRAAFTTRRSSPDLEMLAKVNPEERLEEIRRKLVAAQDIVAELAAVGESDAREVTREVDIVSFAMGECKSLEPKAARLGVELRAVAAAEGDSPGAMVRVAPRLASLLLRELISHALAASPRGRRVTFSVHPPTHELGARITVDDSGTKLSAGAREALLSLEVEPGTFGRPNTIALFVAAEITGVLGARLEIADAPADEGGVRVSVTFPR